jgi:branched-chain amino acid transport system permease protein
MALLLQVIMTGLAAGAGYGLVAIGYALIYQLTGVIHFALGELVALAVFVTLLLAAGTGPVTRTSVSTGKFLPALGTGLLVAAATGVVVYLLAVRPFLQMGLVLGWIGGTVAVAFGVRSLLATTFVRESYVFPDPIPFARLAHGGVLDLGGGVTLPVRTFFVIGVGFALAELAALFLNRTKWGRALQAIASNREGAYLIGLPVERLVALAFALAGVLAAVAGVVAAPGGPLSADTGALLGLKGLVAALVGGFGSPRRVFGLGLLVGVVEAGAANLHLGPIRLGAEYRDIIPLALALTFLAMRRLAGTTSE